MKSFILSLLALVAVIVTGCNNNNDCNKQCKPIEPSASAKAFDSSLTHREEALQARHSEDRKEDRKDLRDQESSLRLRQEREVESARLYAEKLKEFEFKSRDQSLEIEKARAKIDLRAVQQQNTTAFLRELSELKKSGASTATSVADLARGHKELNQSVKRGSDSLEKIAEKMTPKVVKETTVVTKTNEVIKEVIKYVDRPTPVPAPASPPTTTNAMGIVVNIGGVTFNLTPTSTNPPPAVVTPKPAAPPVATPPPAPKAPVKVKAPKPPVAPATVQPPAKAPVAKAPVAKAGRSTVTHTEEPGKISRGAKDWPVVNWFTDSAPVIQRKFTLEYTRGNTEDQALAQKALDLFIAHQAKELLKEASPRNLQGMFEGFVNRNTDLKLGAILGMNPMVTSEILPGGSSGT